MYESPIEIIQDEMRTEYEDGILRVVQRFNIHCNKEDLIRALAYDRDQYRKGYRDGRADRMGEWIEDSELWYETLYRCSKCGKKVSNKSTYCPDCGAKMRGEEE